MYSVLNTSNWFPKTVYCTKGEEGASELENDRRWREALNRNTHQSKVNVLQFHIYPLVNTGHTIKKIESMRSQKWK